MNAPRDAWGELEIDPTRDLVAVKRAYARRLKVTRPDDDPDAFQRLRAAYDFACSWAAQAPAPAAGSTPSFAIRQVVVPTLQRRPASLASSAVTARSSVDEVEPADTIARRALLDRFLTGEAIAAGETESPGFVDELRHAVDEVPLGMRDHVSLRAAVLVAREFGVPDTLVVALDDIFGWSTDYRHLRNLAPSDLGAFATRLDGVRRRAGHRRWVEALTHARYDGTDDAGRVRLLQSLLERSSLGQARLYAALASSRILLAWDMLAAPLNVTDPRMPAEGSRLIARMRQWRLVALFALLGAPWLIEEQDPGRGLWYACCFGLGAAFAWVLIHLFDGFFQEVSVRCFEPLGKRSRLSRFGPRTRTVILGVALIGLGSTLFRWLPSRPEPNPLILFALVMAAWFALVSSPRPRAFAVLLLVALGMVEGSMLGWTAPDLSDLEALCAVAMPGFVVAAIGISFLDYAPGFSQRFVDQPVGTIVDAFEGLGLGRFLGMPLAVLALVMLSPLLVLLPPRHQSIGVAHATGLLALVLQFGVVLQASAWMDGTSGSIGKFGVVGAFLWRAASILLPLLVIWFASIGVRGAQALTDRVAFFLARKAVLRESRRRLV